MATLIQLMQNHLDSQDPLLPVETRRIVLKELLHAYVLDYLYNHPAYRLLNFYGGTCLHLLYGLDRLSEDLDFDNRSNLDLSRLDQDLLDHFRKTFSLPSVSARVQQGTGTGWAPGILRITLKFPVLNALRLSPYPEEALHLKLEISHHPQVAVIQFTPLLTHGRSLVAAHFSLETMFAGKVLACLERSFEKGQSGITVKGRDFYDLVWFMQQRLQPLESKLALDGQQPYTTSTAMRALLEKAARLRPQDLALDLLPLFPSRAYIEAWLAAFPTLFPRLAAPYL